MTQFAYFNSAIATPSPVIGWYDSADFNASTLATLPGADLLALTPAQWDDRMSGQWAVSSGILVAYTPPPPPAPTTAEVAQAAYDAAVAAGVQITSTGTPALNGIYSLSQLSLSRITSEQVYLATAAKFTNGGTTRSWLDQTGAPHTFPSTVAFTGFAEAVALYDDALIAALDAGLAGAEWVAPAQPAAIA
jgi:hypothetical protein